MNRTKFTRLYSIRIDDEDHQHEAIQPAGIEMKPSSRLADLSAFPFRGRGEFDLGGNTRNRLEVLVVDGFR